MKHHSIDKILFVIFLVLYSALSAYLAYGLEIYHNDAISRTALAFFTVFGRNPHLAAIGFVWQPLPSLAQIPFMLLLKPFNLMLLAGPLVTSIAGAFSVLTVYKIGQVLGENKHRLIALLFAVLFGLNPLIFLYASIGTSESIFIASLLGASYYMLRWFYVGKQQHLLLSGLFVALSFWSRYEALPVFAGFAGVIILKSLIDKVGLKQIESSLLQFILPFLYSVFLWILLNFMIMKDPFYFLNSPYSNPAFTALFKTNPSFLENSYHSVMHSFLYMVKRVAILAPILGLLAVVASTIVFSRGKKLYQSALFSLLSFPYLAILLFHVYQLYKGESFGWLRFFMYAIVWGTLIALYLAVKHKAFAFLAIILVLGGIVSTGYAISNHDLGREEESFVQKIEDNSKILDYSRTYKDQKNIATIMDALPGIVLLDTDKGFAIPMFAQNPNRYIITSDTDYEKIVKNYPSYVSWVIIPKPAADDRGQNKIYTYYPKIWEGIAPKITLYKEVDNWKIYKVGDTDGIVQTSRKSSPKATTTCEYQVHAGDSLSRISKRELGLNGDTTLLEEMNKETFALSSHVHPKQILKVPCVVATKI